MSRQYVMLLAWEKGVAQLNQLTIPDFDLVKFFLSNILSNLLSISNH